MAMGKSRETYKSMIIQIVCVKGHDRRAEQPCSTGFTGETAQYWDICSKTEKCAQGSKVHPGVDIPVGFGSHAKEEIRECG